MASSQDPPASYNEFVSRYPKHGQAWDLIREGEKNGPLDAKTIRLLKLAIAMGALREGAVHSGVRKAVKAGASREEIEQLIALAPGTLGFPATVALFSWMRETLDTPGKK